MKLPLYFLLAASSLCTLLVSPTTVTAEVNFASSEFSRTTIDLGVVVSDLDKAVKFYTEAIGFKEVKGFTVPGSFCADSGLTDGAPLKVRVVVLSKGKSSTRLKLMALPGVKSKPSDNRFIHSQLGFSYLTIRVNDTNAALARLKKFGAKPLAKGPVPVSKDTTKGIYLSLVQDPDGNLIELIGPKK